MEYTIRKRRREDCVGVAHVVTVAWNETYRGIVPDEFLDNLYKDEEERAINSYNKFNEKENTSFVLEVDNEVVGFTSYGKARDEDYSDCGEIFALYIIKKYQGNKFGKKLVDTAVNELKKMNYNKMIIGCLKDNPATKFYEHIGGKCVKTTIFKTLNLPENIYYYDNI